MSKAAPRQAPIWIVLLATLAVPLRSAEIDLGAELIEAAQQNRTEVALELLDRGADIESATRYGATALFFAADKGNVQLVRALIERGADINVTDTFYSANPTTWAMFKAAESEPHREVLLELVRAGADAAGQALAFAATRGDGELTDAALATDKIAPDELRRAAQAALDGGHEELGRKLKALAPEAEPSTAPKLTREDLERFAGDYRNEEIGLTTRISATESGALRLEREGQPDWTFDATGESSFTARELEMDLNFNGRGGLIESFELASNGRTFVLTRFEPNASSEPHEPKTAEELPTPVRRKAAPWPSFRGPRLSGIADGQGAPTEWAGESGLNVLWKTPIPGIGLSSPIIWGDSVFVTTAISSSGDTTFRTGLYGDVDSVADDSQHSWKVFALDRSSGEVRWERTAAVAIPEGRRHTKSSHANPTPVTDGRRLVAHFGSQGLFCYDFDGKLLWSREFGHLSSGWFYDPTYEWGFSSSPILFEDLVIVQVDIQKGSFIAALDLETGAERWRTERDEIPTWGTPNLLPGGDGPTEVVTNGTTVRGYDAKSGKELWQLGPNSEITVGSPILGDGVIYVTGGYPPVRPIYAIRPGGRGDLTLPTDSTTSEHVVWSVARGGTYIPTPIVYDGVLYMLHNDGRLTAHEAATGELLYRKRVGKAQSFSGSPIAADGRLYFTSEEGFTFVVRSGPVYELIAENALGEVVMTTPAVSDGVLVIRAMEHIYGLGELPAAADGSESEVGR